MAKSLKLFVKIQYSTGKHTAIRVDNIPNFQKYLNDPEMFLYFQKQTMLIRLGQKATADPYVYEVEESEFESLVKDIKSKISSSHKSEMHFQQISICEDSRHYPLIKIVTVNREEKEENK